MFTRQLRAVARNKKKLQEEAPCHCASGDTEGCGTMGLPWWKSTSRGVEQGMVVWVGVVGRYRKTKTAVTLSSCRTVLSRRVIYGDRSRFQARGSVTTGIRLGSKYGIAPPGKC